MKKFLLLFVLLPAAFNSEAQEAATIPSGFGKMITKLSVMHYLDQAALTYFLNGFEGNVAAYYEGVVKDNPVPDFDINAYLDFKEPPMEATVFLNAIAEKNAASLLEIIEEYGYPSFSRLKPFVKNAGSLSASIFIDRAPEKYKKKFRQALRDQYREGNMTKREYAVCMRFAKSDDINIYDEEIKAVQVAGMKE